MEYLGKLAEPSHVYLRAVALWLRYYVDCDLFDGTKGPPYPWMRAESARFARERSNAVWRELGDMSRADAMNARNEAEQRSDESPESIDAFLGMVARLPP